MFQLGTLYTIFCNDISILTNYSINVNVLQLLEISLSIRSVTNKKRRFWSLTTSVIFWMLTNFIKLDANYLNTKVVNILILYFICLSNFKISGVNDFNKQLVNTLLLYF